MRVHPQPNRFQMRYDDGSVGGKRHHIELTDAQFIINHHLQQQMLDTGHRTLHAYVQGRVLASEYGRVPVVGHGYQGWQEATYKPAAGATFMLDGDPIDPAQVFGMVVCTMVDGKPRVLVQKKVDETLDTPDTVTYV